MTKKHFIALADAIKRFEEQAARENHPDWCFNFAQLKMLTDFCASQNPQFNRQRWLDYIDGKCGPNGGKIK